MCGYFSTLLCYLTVSNETVWSVRLVAPPRRAADAPGIGAGAWLLLALLWVGVNAAALAAEALWQRTVERAWNAACARRRETQASAGAAGTQ